MTHKVASFEQQAPSFTFPDVRIDGHSVEDGSRQVSMMAIQGSNAPAALLHNSSKRLKYYKSKRHSEFCKHQPNSVVRNRGCCIDVTQNEPLDTPLQQNRVAQGLVPTCSVRVWASATVVYDVLLWWCK
ncbi:hypothetical protein CDEST_03147 [Colletotrichum destructivum]|uniref:Uncharacterized protein n=1 Tax=Colletotrichum destructivum TaxID=34406 RepID=A0AAX4I588_9PEZI|nr:hypothetical protein CDEST_03147 [Colletotrichum destructivum]